MTLETSKTAIAEMFLMKNCFVTIFLTNEIGGEYDNFGYEGLVVGQEQNFIIFLGGVRRQGWGEGVHNCNTNRCSFNFFQNNKSQIMSFY